MTEDAEARPQRGIQSIEVGGQLLRALVHTGQPMALGDLAREAEMTPAKAHPYLVSFGRLGLIEQDEATGRYRLGALSLQLGLIGLQQSDPVQLAMPAVRELAQAIGQAVGIAVWGSRGATTVHIVESPAAVYVAMRHGTAFSLAHTAPGRLFGAYMGAEEVKRLFEAERLQRQNDGAPPAGMPQPAPMPAWLDFETQLKEVRRQGLSRSEGETVPGVNAMSAPVFDHTGRIVLGITAIGTAATFDSRWQGAVARALKDCSAALSQRLGCRNQPNG